MSAGSAVQSGTRRRLGLGADARRALIRFDATGTAQARRRPVRVTMYDRGKRSRKASAVKGAAASGVLAMALSGSLWWVPLLAMAGAAVIAVFAALVTAKVSVPRVVHRGSAQPDRPAPVAARPGLRHKDRGPAMTATLRPRPTSGPWHTREQAEIRYAGYIGTASRGTFGPASHYNLCMLIDTCELAGELGAHDVEVLRQLAELDTLTCAVVCSLIQRAAGDRYDQAVYIAVPRPRHPSTRKGH